MGKVLEFLIIVLAGLVVYVVGNAILPTERKLLDRMANKEREGKK